MIAYFNDSIWVFLTLLIFPPLSLSYSDHDKRSWRCTALMAAFVLLELFLNASSREQAHLVRGVSDSSESVVVMFLMAVTLAQLGLAMILLNPLTSRGEIPCKEALGVIALSHIGGTFLHDFLASFGSQENSLTLTFLAPVLTLAMVWTVTSIVPRANTWLSISAACFGCIFLTLNVDTVSATDRTSLISGLSTVFIVLRNIVIRHLVVLDNVTIKPRGSAVNASVIGGIFILLVAVYVLGSAAWVTPTLCAAFTSYLSTGVVFVSIYLLKSYSVVFVSLFQMWATLLEALVLTPNEHRPDIMVGLLALGMVAGGHYFFFKDFLDNGSSHGSGAIGQSKNGEFVSLLYIATISTVQTTYYLNFHSRSILGQIQLLSCPL